MRSGRNLPENQIERLIIYFTIGGKPINVRGIGHLSDPGQGRGVGRVIHGPESSSLVRWYSPHGSGEGLPWGTRGTR
jgi:hypothetical protein